MQSFLSEKKFKLNYFYNKNRYIRGVAVYLQYKHETEQANKQ